MPPTVRTFDEHDRGAVVDLSLRAWAPVFASVERVLGPSGIFARMHTDWRADQQRAVEAVLGAEDTSVWVAQVEAAVAGFVAVRLDHGESIGEIYMIAVDPDHQRHGIGTMLTTFALRWAKEQGMALAMVETGGDPGHAPARRTYERAGFTELPVSRYFATL